MWWKAWFEQTDCPVCVSGGGHNYPRVPVIHALPLTPGSTFSSSCVWVSALPSLRHARHVTRLDIAGVKLDIKIRITTQINHLCSLFRESYSCSTLTYTYQSLQFTSVPLQFKIDRYHLILNSSFQF